MAKYIPLDAVVAEIERLIERANAERVLHPKTILAAKNYLLIEDYNKLLSFLDTLEVKEVDLDFMLHEYWNLSSKITIDCLESATMTKDEMINFAKHFFELGLKAQKGE